MPSPEQLRAHPAIHLYGAWPCEGGMTAVRLRGVHSDKLEALPSMRSRQSAPPPLDASRASRRGSGHAGQVGP